MAVNASPEVMLDAGNTRWAGRLSRRRKVTNWGWPFTSQWGSRRRLAITLIK
jgi:hypothetical protein